MFGLGGYVSFPISVAAKMLNIPLMIYENNMVLGRTNSYLLPFAKKILLATDTISNYPPKYKTKIKKVGHVIREDILNYSPLQNKKQNGHFSILVLGGSQGAEIFGIIIPKVIKRMNENGFKIKIYHQCIKNQEEKLKNFYRENNISNNVFEFTDNILEFILKSDIAISRCGASTTAELVYTNTPFIAVPYPHAVDNHQYWNAKHYEEKGHCWIIEQSNFNNETLFNLIIKIFKDKKKIIDAKENMEKNDFRFTYQNIENAIKDII